MFLGRVVRPGVDPLWLPTDAGLALAWQQNKAATCAGCGTRPDEWDADREAYMPDQHYCRGCELLAMERESAPKGADGRPLLGRHPFLTPRAAWEAAHPDEDDA